MIFIWIEPVLVLNRQPLKMPEKKIVASKCQMLKSSLEKNVEVKAKQRGYNSFAAPSNNHTYQVDLFFMGYYDFDEHKFRGGLVAIDVLSKYAVVIPIKTKNGEDVLEATKEALGKMGKKPKMIYTDDERAIAGEEF